MLSAVGAVLALKLSGNALSVVVFIGLILLVGLVVKNAIILIDKVNQLREEGVAKREALVEGARSRLRPIMMTTLCAVFGFLPLALAFGEGAEVRSPMAITVIGGLIALWLTLHGAAGLAGLQRAHLALATGELDALAVATPACTLDGVLKTVLGVAPAKRLP